MAAANAFSPTWVKVAQSRGFMALHLNATTCFKAALLASRLPRRIYCRVATMDIVSTEHASALRDGVVQHAASQHAWRAAVAMGNASMAFVLVMLASMVLSVQWRMIVQRPWRDSYALATAPVTMAFVLATTALRATIAVCQVACLTAMGVEFATKVVATV
mmetsp:Transcript_67736/g.185744  ORF Transcript_67736/g.185744 Transcript_67736/m.185744 type:complete len:161 (-) Transcript_67736:2398-2880(-)|eukprot:1879809-Prymnesium_polylepis.4